MFAVLRRTFISVLLAGAMMALAPSTTNAQFAKNAAYVELLGNGLFYTVNYERFFGPELSARGGLMVFSVSETENGTETSGTVNVVPLTANYFLGDSHRLELGAGPVLFRLSASVDTPGLSDSDSGVAFFGTATVGYRYQSPGGGFLFRIGLTPIISGDGVAPWGGLSVGWAF